MEQVTKRRRRGRSRRSRPCRSTPRPLGDGLQLAEVRAPAGDDDPQAGHGCAAATASPSTRSGSPSRTGGGPRSRPAARRRHAAARGRAAPTAPTSTPLGMTSTLSRGRSNAATHLLDHVARAGDHAVGLVREPPLDGVDAGRLAGREVAAVATPLGGVDGGDERCVPQRRGGCRRPTPPASRGRGRRRVASRRGRRRAAPWLVVGRGHAGDEVARRAATAGRRGPAAPARRRCA